MTPAQLRALLGVILYGADQIRGAIYDEGIAQRQEKGQYYAHSIGDALRLADHFIKAARQETQ